MKRIVPVIALMLTSAVSTALAAEMDTNAAGKCVALGALSKEYESKATIILAAASAKGDRAVVEQRAREEFVDLTRNRQDDMAKKGWVSEAVRACERF
jgi:hypothetical protein